MDAAEFFQVETPEQYVWPVTYRFHFRAPWGDTQQELSVDAPELEGQLQQSFNLGAELWSRAIAPAISRDVSCIAWDTVCWKHIAAGFPAALPQMLGGVLEAPLPRDNTPVAVLHTGHADDLSRRRFFFPGAPASWVASRMLTLEGWDRLEDWGVAMGAGLSRSRTNAPMQLLLAYPQLLPPSIENPSGVAFRPVRHIRGMLLTARAPDPSAQPWP